MNDAKTSVTPSPVLEVQNLSRWYAVRLQWKRVPLRVLSNISFTLERGETFALVGESGAGKSTLARCVLTLEQPSAGMIRLGGQPVNWKSKEQLRRLRSRLGWVHQHYRMAFNPQKTIGWSLYETVRFQNRERQHLFHEKVKMWLERVHLESDVLQRYPHELSGGQLQRCALIRAFIHEPILVICDEPTSALDLPVQKNILTLLKKMCDEMSVSMLYITHDLSVIGMLSQSCGVLYRGVLVEKGKTDHILAHPLHPYTQKLMESIPISHPKDRKVRAFKFSESSEDILSSEGCVYKRICPLVQDICFHKEPELRKIHSHHEVACHVIDYEKIHE